MREWLNRTVSKTVVPSGTVGSNPTLSVLQPAERNHGGRLPATKIASDLDLGEVRERSNRHAWRACVHHVDRGFESHPLRYFGAVAQLGERQNRNLEVGGSIPLCSTRKAGRQAVGVPAIPYYRLVSITVVLDGELAVPCNPQSATAGSNSHPEDRTCVAGMRCIRY